MVDRFDGVSDGELTERLHELMGEVRGLRAQQRIVTAELDRRAALREAEGVVAGLGAEGKAALAQVLAAEGVPSGEGFGHAGA